ncbi:hypothetical protein FRC06_007877, partial [Ceratobasidium sp. 370]
MGMEFQNTTEKSRPRLLSELRGSEHRGRTAAKQYPEFDIFAKQGRWPLRAFVHSILRTSSNLYQENSGQRQSKKKKGEKATEDHPPAVDQSMCDGIEPLAGIPPPLNGDQPRPADESMRDGQPPVPDESMRTGDEPPFGMDPLFGNDSCFHIQPDSNPEPLPEEPALPPGVFDDDDDEESHGHAVASVLKDLGNVTLDSIDGEDGRAISPAATHTNHPAQGEPAPPAPKSTPPARKSAQPASLTAKAPPACAPAQAPTYKPSLSVEADPPAAKPAPQTTYTPALRTSTAQAPSVRAPAQAPAGKSVMPSSALATRPVHSSGKSATPLPAPAAPPVRASKSVPTTSPNPPAPMPESDGEDIDIAADMLAKLE